MTPARSLACLALLAVTGCASMAASPPDKPTTAGALPMKLGNFSVSLAVKDLAASRAFYEKLGFRPVGGNGKSWLILRNDSAKIGLFQGMFPKNTLTFNPGWDANCQVVPGYTDVRELQRQLKAKGVGFQTEADETTSGPAHFVVVDPDGNPVLVDQHI